VAANMTKLIHGAWVPLLIGLTAFTVMTTWQRGREIVITRQRERAEGPLGEFIDRLPSYDPPLVRVAGTAVFLNRGKRTAPLAMRARGAQSRASRTGGDHGYRDAAGPARAGRRTVDAMGSAEDRVIHVVARFGYMERPNVPGALRLLDPGQTEGPIDVDGASYFLSKLELRKGTAPTMAPWRKSIFIATSYITADAAEYFNLPIDRTVVMGSRIEV
jgi:KUP system potassium uptake protein